MNAAPKCRFCGTPLTKTFVNLGEMPLANSYLHADQVGKPEPRYPLHARVCSECRLVQVDAVTTPDAIFSDYAYFSSTSASWVAHARRFVMAARECFLLGPDSKVVEVASNDGYLLRHFVELGVPVLGVEPAANVAKVAREAGVPTDVAFFSLQTASRLKSEGHAADLVVGNNVFAHVPDINDFVAGLAEIVKPQGVISLEFPHLLRLIEGSQFDTIYHEHYSYLSLLTTERIFAAHGLRVFDVEELPTHGGSLRVSGCRIDATHAATTRLEDVRRAEAEAGLDTDHAYEGFTPKVEVIRAGLLDFLNAEKAAGRTVAAYGAAAKGNTLLNYCGIGPELIAYVADLSPHKQGLYLPGSQIPILSPLHLTQTKPKNVLILPWNLRNEIVGQLDHLKTSGTRFVVAVPSLADVEPVQET